MAEYLPKEVIIPTAHLETQDLILTSDVVLSDYSSIVFDALTINMPTALYTPDVATYERNVAYIQKCGKHSSVCVMKMRNV